ncbi:glutathione S-transferase [Roseivivax sp. GX 12232]|uniref:glutathione S-transferase n=1 Tax=Roseivivax sp. GX 12232 TaxID=2900547 RepID=UPI001E51622B|nr:glutathione S-transferase [Roseivivax sp. GX 12232]MCE0505779.1 glutathione S-transferase [Roseivivax sp. GX 12232]
MKLYKLSPSPYVRKVRVVLEETGMADAVETVEGPVSPMDPDPDLVALAPLGKIPALVREDGATLYDSRVICRYLDAKAGAGLYPEARIWEVLTLEATGDGMLDATLLMTYEGRHRTEAQYSTDWVEAQWLKVTRALDALEGRWMSHLAGPLDAGQIAVGCALGYLDLRQDARNWRAGRPALAAWFEGFAARPSMQATAPEG